jgi:ATP-dependent Lhr-like helicase
VDAEEALVEIIRGRLEGLGPVTVDQLIDSSGLNKLEIETALLRLEAEGFVIRGKFTPGTTETEWSARRLLARIHSYTLNRLRQEIEPVAASDFIRFLLAWQKVAPDHQMEGPESLKAIIEQLEGVEAPAAAWEGELLPTRMVEYDPAWLDALCLSGEVFGRDLLHLHVRRQTKTVKEHVDRVRLEILRSRCCDERISHFGVLCFHNRRRHEHDRVFNHNAAGLRLSDNARRVVLSLTSLKTRSCCAVRLRKHWLSSLRTASLSRTVSQDLRALLTPGSRKTQAAARRKHRQPVYDMASAGRWSILQRNPTQNSNDQTLTEEVAWALIKRYGVVFKRLLEREGIAMPWRVLLRFYHRLEARGDIRGGRFVAGISGEQFALPEAIGMLRAIRRAGPQESLIS